MRNVFIFLLMSSFGMSAQVINEIEGIEGNELDIINLDLSNSGLTEFPKEILACKNIETLNLSNNGLTDLPVELGTLKSLTRLDLSENEGIDSEDLERVFKETSFTLEILNLSGCDLIAVPEEVAQQKKIRYLNLSNNNLTSLPYRFIEMDKIEYVDFSNNYFYDLSWLLKYYWNIKSIDLSNNQQYRSGNTLVELGYSSGLDKIALDNLTSFPLNTPLLMNEISIQNSFISNFLIAEAPINIKRITFDNCQFDADNYSKKAVISQTFECLKFANIQEIYLDRMQFLSADTLVFRNCKMNKKMFDNLDSTIKYIDLRSIVLSNEDIEYIKEVNPTMKIDFKEKLVEMDQVNPPFKRLVRPADIKVVPSENESVIVFKDAAIKIPKNAFKNANGQEYTGPVKISFKSFMNPIDILLSGIPMTMNKGDETFMFSSGGMIDIDGKGSNGEQLALQKPLEVTISSPNSNSEMNLYTLNNSSNSTTWEETGKDVVIEPFKLDQRLVDSIANQNFSKMALSTIIELTPRLVPFVVNDREDDRDGFIIGFKILTASTPVTSAYQTKRYQYLMYDNTAMPYFTEYDFHYYGDSAKFYKSFIKAIADTCSRTYRKFYNSSEDSYSVSGPQFIQNFSLKPNIEKDVFEVNFNYKGKRITLPVILTNRSGNLKKEIKLNSKFYKGYKKEVHKTELNRIKANKIIVLRNKSTIRQREITREKARQKMMYDKQMALKQNAAFMAAKATKSSLFRSFQIAQFGIFNCDIMARMIQPKRITDFVKDIKSKLIMIVDFDKNGVIQFDEIGKAFFDAASKTAIIIFLSENKYGIFKWRNGAHSEMKELNTENVSNAQVLEKLLR